jgi:Carboxypeptidase regulatory-like domain
MRATALLSVIATGLGCTHPHMPHAAKGMIAGQVRDALSGVAVADAVIVLRRPEQIEPLQEHSNGDGAFMIPELAPGLYHVTAYVQQVLIGERDAEVRPNEIIGIDFTLPSPGAINPELNSPGAPTLWRFRHPGDDPASGTIEGTVADVARHQRLEGAVVSATVSGEMTTVQTVTDEQGRFHFDHLAPGSYDVGAYYTVIRRGQLEVRRNRVEVGGGDTVVVPLWLEVESQ